jgi:hypothetical protein
MGGACSAYGGEVYTGFWQGKLREMDHLENPGVDGRIILLRIIIIIIRRIIIIIRLIIIIIIIIWIFRKLDVGVWIGSS